MSDEKMLDRLSDILQQVMLHHRERPDHGIDCACMDRLIQRFRSMTKVANPKMQQRVDYVILTSLNR